MCILKRFCFLSVIAIASSSGPLRSEPVAITDRWFSEGDVTFFQREEEPYKHGRRDWTFEGVAMTYLFSGPDDTGQIDGAIPAYYDPATGNVTADMTYLIGDTLTSYVLELPRGSVQSGAIAGFRTENFTPFLGGIHASAHDYTVGETNFDAGRPGVYSFGNILPAGLTKDEYMNDYFSSDAWWLVPQSGLGVSMHMHPVYAPSPFPAINDPNVGLGGIEDWATDVALLYNPTNGELVIDSTGSRGPFLQYEVQFDDDVVRTVNFRPRNEDFGIATANSIIETSMTGFEPGWYNIGEVLPAGLSLHEVTAMIDDAHYLGRPGTNSRNAFDIGLNGSPMRLAIVPEPSSFGAICWVFVATLLCSRRKRGLK